MKIIIQNCGPIKYFDFDVEKDFHIIVGENNIGKSYAITIVYLLLKNMVSSDVSFNYYFKNVVLDRAEDAGMLFPASHEGDVDVTKDATKILKEVLDGVLLESFHDSLRGTFESISYLQSQFSDEPFCIKIDTELLEVSIGIEENKIVFTSFEIKTQFVLRKSRQRRSPIIRNGVVIIYHHEDDRGFSWDGFSRMTMAFALSFIEEITSNIRAVHYLPASRSGLYQALSAFGQIVAELARNRSYLRNKIELPAISEPLSDYFLKLSNISTKKSQIDKSLEQIAVRIEEDILNGKVEFDSNTKRLMFRPNQTGLLLDIATTSSMVSEISPIVLYLRYILSESVKKRGLLGRLDERRQKEGGNFPKHLIFIEEPEAHLHPKVQMRLTEAFAELVNAGIKIVVTSHSSYVFGKVNNLIVSGGLKHEKVQAQVFKFDAHGATGKHLAVDRFGIDDDNFIESAELLLADKMKSLPKHTRRKGS